MTTLVRSIAVSLVFFAGAAFAHTELSESTPADKAALEQAPHDIVLRFSEAVRLTALSITKQGGKAVQLSPLPAGNMERFSVAVPSVDTGAYTVEWRALGDDGHAVHGSFAFTVGAAAAHGEHSQHTEHTGTAPAEGSHAEHSDGADHADHAQHHAAH